MLGSLSELPGLLLSHLNLSEYGKQYYEANKDKVKQYREERELTILLVVDISQSTSYGSVHHSKREKLAEIAALLAFSANRNGDKVGLLLVSDQAELFLPPTKGQKHVLRILREVLFRPSVGKGTNLNEGLRIANQVMKRRAVVFLLSDFIIQEHGSEEESNTKIFLDQMASTRSKHDLICAKVHDPVEKKFPAVGLVEMEDSESREKFTIDTSDQSIQSQFENSFVRQGEEFSRDLKKRGIDIFSFATDSDYSKELYSFFKMREKRRR